MVGLSSRGGTHHFAIRVDAERLTVEYRFGDGFVPTRLYVATDSVSSEDVIGVDVATTSGTATFNVDDILDALERTDRRVGDDEDDLGPAAQGLRLRVSGTGADGRAQDIRIGAPHSFEFISDGPFQRGDYVITPYVAGTGRPAIAVSHSTVNLPSSVKVTHWKRRPSLLGLRGTIILSNYAPVSIVMRLIGRTTGRHVELPVSLRPRGSVDGRLRYAFAVDIRAADILVGAEDNEVFDPRFFATYAHGAEAMPLRFPQCRALARATIPAPLFTHGTVGAEFRAYLTFKAKVLAFELRMIDPAAVPIIRRAPLAHASNRIKQSIRRVAPSATAHPVWVLGERLETAQDNGVALYRHLRDHHPEIDAYYVINAKSPDRSALGDDPHVLEAGTREHAERILQADRVIATHHPDYLLPVRGQSFQRAVTAPRVFAQHGVMGTKNMVSNYGFRVRDFAAEAFLVSSRREQRMIVQDFAWPESLVHVTGLARFDRLFDANPPPQRRLLVMPTWRDWLKDEAALEASEYLERWTGLLASDAFKELCERHELTVDMYLHFNMRAYLPRFATERVNLITPGSIPIQDLLIRSMVMLTDYTSAAMDFAFLDRSVVYYQFDRTEFIGRRPSHFDLDRELPGDITDSAAGVLRALEAAIERDGAITPENRRRADNLIAHRDTKSSERIVELARSELPRPAHPAPWQDSWETLKRLWRRSDARRRLRMGIYRMAATLPTRRALVVFETDNGAGFGDSPGAIFEEIHRRYPRMALRWCFKGVDPEFDEPVRGVRRGTIAHAWALGRATVWISNQNQPYAFRRPKRTFYLQTWHGTPLKRMLFDLDRIVGRTEGYEDRMRTMISEWSVLSSPSPWATTQFRSAFDYRGPVWELGYPRNDALVNDASDVRAEAREKLAVATDARVIVYAPTFRDDQKYRGQFSFDIPLEFDVLREAIDPTDEIVVRLHPVVARSATLPPGIRNGNTGIDMFEVMCAADILITDYSSVFFDFALLDRPIIFFTPDLDSYRDELRGFYLDFESEAPGPICRSTEEVAAYLADPAALAAFEAKRQAFKERFCPHDDGHAARRTVDALERVGAFRSNAPGRTAARDETATAGVSRPTASSRR